MAKKEEVKEVNKHHSDLWNKTLEFGKKAVLTVTVVSAFFTGVGWVAAKVWHKEIEQFWNTADFVIEAKEQMLPANDSTHAELSSRIKIIEDYIEKKKEKFAVGLRKERDGDLWYKNIDGKLYRAIYYNNPGAFYFLDKEGNLQECH